MWIVRYGGVVRGRWVVGGDREEVVSSGGEEVVGGCSWANIVRGSTWTHSVTPPPHSDLCDAAERAGRSCSPRVGWGPVAPLTIRRHADGHRVAFLCESEHGEWCCSNCSRNYHSFSSLTQHLH